MSLSYPLDVLLDKIRLYRSVFEIQYLRKVRKLLLELLVEAGLPREVVHRYLLPYVAPHLPYFCSFRCIRYNYNKGRIDIHLFLNQVRIELIKPHPLLIEAQLVVGDDRLCRFPSTRNVLACNRLQLPSFRVDEEASLGNLIHYCYCFYQLGDTSLLSRPDNLPTLPTLCKKMKAEPVTRGTQAKQWLTDVIQSLQNFKPLLIGHKPYETRDGNTS